MHRRLFPKENAFNYRVYYFVLPLPAPPIPGRLMSFYPKDIGRRDGSDPTEWARSILEEHGLNQNVQNIVLITMPRVLGYIFNPVSFYLCWNQHKQLQAVLCEVHNTFGEQHSYLCVHPDRRPISDHDILQADKLFHVSPFLERDGYYTFRFDCRDQKIGIWIDYYDKNGEKQLVTSLMGSLSPLTKQTMRRAFWRYPLVTLRAISLIHWQALRLVLKGIRYIPKPLQLKDNVTATNNLNKM